jgi:uncharacterized protein (TIGR00661 family)
MRILVAPLNWGLGHATRCVPIINYLSELKHEVVLASSGNAYHFLKNYFPKFELVHLPDYDVLYSTNIPLKWRMVLSAPKIFSKIKQEHQLLDKLIDEKKIDAVISDNRFGLHSKKIPCAFISHQLNINAGLFSGIANRINRKYINKYSQCWIPDNAGSKALSGNLVLNEYGFSHLKHLGPLSRFMNCPLNNPPKQNQIAIIISGPEPQRTVFEKIIFSQIQKYKSQLKSKVVIVRGMPGEKTGEVKTSLLSVFNHLSDNEMLRLIANSNLIISRSGFSTIMDLAYTGGKAVFVPTPGQPEQEYLAKLYHQNKIAFSVDQKKFDLMAAISVSENFLGFRQINKNESYKKVVDGFLATI